MNLSSAIGSNAPARKNHYSAKSKVRNNTPPGHSKSRYLTCLYEFTVALKKGTKNHDTCAGLIGLSNS
jgi:hypothetical protein